MGAGPPQSHTSPHGMRRTHVLEGDEMGEDSRSSAYFKPIRVLLVEDCQGSLEALAAYLRTQPGIRIDGSSDSGLLAGVRAIFETPDAVLVSAGLVGFTVWDTVRLIKQVTPRVAVVVLGTCNEPHAWLRHGERPDAIMDDPDDHGAIAELIRDACGSIGVPPCCSANTLPSPPERRPQPR